LLLLGVEGGRKLLNSPYAKRLPADYLQMAHHGQNGVEENSAFPPGPASRRTRTASRPGSQRPRNETAIKPLARSYALRAGDGSRSVTVCRFRPDTRPGGGTLAATMARNRPEYQYGHGTQWTVNPGTQLFNQKENPMQTTLRKLVV